ncbi:MAG: hypothetical protein COA84_07645 [Robiginitomaculum sp.]|nr:MAG: hypothetical protein COA84_07645 [Robiginitomaculum sp.]
MSGVPKYYIQGGKYQACIWYVFDADWNLLIEKHCSVKTFADWAMQRFDLSRRDVGDLLAALGR